MVPTARQQYIAWQKDAHGASKALCESQGWPNEGSVHYSQPGKQDALPTPSCNSSIPCRVCSIQSVQPVATTEMANNSTQLCHGPKGGDIVTWAKPLKEILSPQLVVVRKPCKH